jgi:hypothetical protein
MEKPEKKYMEDAQGRMVPLVAIHEIDLMRNDLVIELMGKARAISEALAAFKGSALEEIQALAELSAEKYKIKLGGRKGNLTLFSYDGRFKLMRSIDEHVAFDERLQAAKALIDECLIRWSEGGNANLRTVVLDAFQVDKAGRINVNRILSLRRIKIDDEPWQEAMAAIGDSLQVVNNKAYVRFYERQGDGSYRQLNLNFSA